MVLQCSLEGTASRKRKVFDIMRSMVSDFISANPDGYNPVVLGCPRYADVGYSLTHSTSPLSIEQYCKFICKRDSWGGAIELSIFSELYEIQICAWDIMTCRMDTYGLDKDYKLRIFVLYDGVHYGMFEVTFYLFISLCSQYLKKIPWHSHSARVTLKEQISQFSQWMTKM